MSSRNGKIARLPADLRHWVNTALYDGESGRRVLRWLNELPEVKQVMARDFGGTRITEENLSQWRQGGYLHYVGQRDLLDQARETYAGAADMDEAVGDLADRLVKVLAARYGALLMSWDGEPTEELERRLKIMGALSRQVTLVQRATHQTQCLAIMQRQYAAEEPAPEPEKVAPLTPVGRSP